MTTKRKVGRPRKFQSVEAFDQAVDAFVAKCKADEEPITWTGMALGLGFYQRQDMDAYGVDYPEFSSHVKRAKFIVESAYEKRMHGNSPTGAIFVLKNMGWTDAQEIKQTTKMDVNLKASVYDLSDEELLAIAAKGRKATP